MVSSTHVEHISLFRYRTPSSLLCLIKNSQCITPIAQLEDVISLRKVSLRIWESKAKNQGEGESMEKWKCDILITKMWKSTNFVMKIYFGEIVKLVSSVNGNFERSGYVHRPLNLREGRVTFLLTFPSEWWSVYWGVTRLVLQQTFGHLPSPDNTSPILQSTNIACTHPPWPYFPRFPKDPIAAISPLLVNLRFS